MPGTTFPNGLKVVEGTTTKSLTGNTTIAANAQVFSANVLKAEAEDLQATVNAIIATLIASGLIKSS